MLFRSENGLLFSTSAQLAELLFDLFEDYPRTGPLLTRLRAGARKSARPTWEEGWAREAREMLLGGSESGATAARPMPSMPAASTPAEPTGR